MQQLQGTSRGSGGTDITRMPCSWRLCATLFTEELLWLRGRDLELVMGRAVCDWIARHSPDTGVCAHGQKFSPSTIRR